MTELWSVACGDRGVVVVMYVYVSVYTTPCFLVTAAYNGFCNILAKLKWISKPVHIKSEYVVSFFF